jgi:chemotaxis response regulator CheB
MIETKVIIIDDEVPARVLLRKYIEQHPFLQIVAECRNGEEAIELINSTTAGSCLFRYSNAREDRF